MLDAAVSWLPAQRSRYAASLDAELCRERTVPTHALTIQVIDIWDEYPAKERDFWHHWCALKMGLCAVYESPTSAMPIGFITTARKISCGGRSVVVARCWLELDKEGRRRQRLDNEETSLYWAWDKLACIPRLIVRPRTDDERRWLRETLSNSCWGIVREGGIDEQYNAVGNIVDDMLAAYKKPDAFEGVAQS